MEIKSSSKKAARNVNRPLYIAFLIGGIYFLITKEFSQAVSFRGITLAFDPFDIKISFSKRPFYQQAWLIVHISITLALIVLLFF